MGGREFDTPALNNQELISRILQFFESACVPTANKKKILFQFLGKTLETVENKRFLL